MFKTEDEVRDFRILQLMMINQVDQGNFPDSTVFKDDVYTGQVDGGFSWLDSNEGQHFWGLVVNYKQYDVLDSKIDLKEPSKTIRKMLIKIVLEILDGIEFKIITKI